jgi:hypothetical protein
LISLRVKLLSTVYGLLWVYALVGVGQAISADDNEMMIASGFIALALSAPLSFLIPGMVGPVLLVFGLEPPEGAGSFLVFIALALSAGLFQWFVVVPSLFRKWRKRAAKRAR